MQEIVEQQAGKTTRRRSSEAGGKTFNRIEDVAGAQR